MNKCTYRALGALALVSTLSLTGCCENEDGDVRADRAFGGFNPVYQAAVIAYYDYHNKHVNSFDGDETTDTHGIINPCARLIESEKNVTNCSFSWNTSSRILLVEANVNGKIQRKKLDRLTKSDLRSVDIVSTEKDEHESGGFYYMPSTPRSF